MLPTHCPSCQEELRVKSLKCNSCQTEVSGSYELPILARLAPDEQDFVLNFMKNSGSLKEMAKQLNLSYPTVRNLLDGIIEKIEAHENRE